MEWYWIVAIAVAAAAVVAVAAVCFARRKRKKSKRVRVRGGEVAIQTVAADEIDETALCEIEDPGVAERVKALMPDVIRTEIAAGLALTTCSKTVYKVILPASAKLAAGVSGSSLPMGATMAAAQVGTLVASSFSAVMSAAAMVVGQYYMTVINLQLKKITERLSRLEEFQDSEFKSKVFALHTQVMRAAAFRAETMENAAMRGAEIEKLDRLEHECIELLGQASLMIADYTAKADLDYPKYIRATTEVDKWYSSQNVLLSTLGEIADLRFALYLGAASRKQCDALLPVYEQQAEETQRMLIKWHADTAERLGVRLGECKRRRRGLDRAVHWLPGLFKKELRYRDMPASTVALIEHQTAAEPVRPAVRSDLFHTDVEIIAKDGKLYYLPKGLPEPKRDGETRPTEIAADTAAEAEGEAADAPETETS